MFFSYYYDSSSYRTNHYTSSLRLSSLLSLLPKVTLCHNKMKQFFLPLWLALCYTTIFPNNLQIMCKIFIQQWFQRWCFHLPSMPRNSSTEHAWTTPQIPLQEKHRYSSKILIILLHTEKKKKMEKRNKREAKNHDSINL